MNKISMLLLSELKHPKVWLNLLTNLFFILTVGLLINFSLSNYINIKLIVTLIWIINLLILTPIANNLTKDDFISGKVDLYISLKLPIIYFFLNKVLLAFFQIILTSIFAFFILCFFSNIFINFSHVFLAIIIVGIAMAIIITLFSLLLSEFKQAANLTAIVILPLILPLTLCAIMISNKNISAMWMMIAVDLILLPIASYLAKFIIKN